MLRALRPDLGARLFRRDLPRASSSTRCGRRARSSSTKRRACRCGRTDHGRRTKHEVDAVTGTATTGHEWDGIHELNTPLPRWWLWLFYATIVWAVGYWVVYPAWPLSDVLQPRRLRLAVAQRRGQRSRRAQGAARRRWSASSRQLRLPRSTPTPELLDFARAQGRAAFADNCAPCHGAGGGGAKGYPNLNDDDWLWGGTLDRHPADHPPRRPLRPTTRPPRRDAGIRPRRHAQARRDRRRRRLRALAVGPADRRRAPISRAARRSSPTIARSATAATARATASSARPI